MDVHTLKPFDKDTIELSKNCKLFVSVEEHSVIGGLGSAIADYISTMKGFPSLYKLGVHDTFSKPGDYDYLMLQHRLTPEMIAEDIKQQIRSL